MKAGISVSNARYEVECSDCGLLDTVLSPQEAQRVAKDHQAWHKPRGDRTRLFSGQKAWTDAQLWSRS